MGGTRKNAGKFNLKQRKIFEEALRLRDLEDIKRKKKAKKIMNDPDVLVKGGDWSVETTIGHDIVPKTVIIPIEEWYSTTNIIDKIIKKEQNNDNK